MSRFRASRSTRSGRPATQNDQDVIDGLPIRQWRFQPSSIANTDDGTSASNTNPAIDAPIRGKGIWIEYPMPKGSEHYPSWCQQILREARLGRLVEVSQGYSRGGFGRVIAKDEDNENGYRTGEGEDGLTGTKRTRTESQENFVANRWMQTPRQHEEPEVEYLAKRRKGLSSVHATGEAPPAVYAPVSTSSVGVVAVAPGTVPINSGTLKRTKVKRVDAQGQTRVWEVLIPVGHPIEGEIDDTLMSTEDAAIPVEKPVAGTIVDGLGVAGDDGAVIASFSALPTVSSHVTPLPPRSRKKQKGGFRKGRSRKLGVGDRGGVSASAESFYAADPNASDLGVTVVSTAATDMDEYMPTTHADEDEDDGSEEGEVDEDDGDEAEGDEMEGEEDPDPDTDMLQDADGDGENDDGLGDEDREEGELTPEVTAVSEPIALLDASDSTGLDPPTLLLSRRTSTQQGADPLAPAPPSDLVQSSAPTIGKLATEPSLPVGAELVEPLADVVDEDQDMALSMADTDSSYAPPEPAVVAMDTGEQSTGLLLSSAAAQLDGDMTGQVDVDGPPSALSPLPQDATDQTPTTTLTSPKEPELAAISLREASILSIKESSKASPPVQSQSPIDEEPTKEPAVEPADVPSLFTSQLHTAKGHDDAPTPPEGPANSMAAPTTDIAVNPTPAQALPAELGSGTEAEVNGARPVKSDPQQPLEDNLHDHGVTDTESMAPNEAGPGNSVESLDEHLEELGGNA